MQKAYNKDVVVVIAWWNWDLLSWQETGVNLTNNPISPVCNNEAKYAVSIWVFATDKDWYRTNWTNYWNCTPFYAPWVDIVSTSIPVYNTNYWTNYNIANWTSFSAPIISWIIALWYNQYWYSNPLDVYNSLSESYVEIKLPDLQTWYILDASKYIDILWLKIKARLTFEKIKSNFRNYSKTKKEKTYNTILVQLDWMKQKLSWDKLLINNNLIYLIKNDMWIN